MKKLYILFIAIFVLSHSYSHAQINFVNKIFQNQDGIYGMGGTMGICLSPDKKNVYVTSQYSLTVFRYDSISGSLNFLTTYKDSVDGFRGLYGAQSVIVSNDNKNVYLVSNGYLSIIDRDASTGYLSFNNLLINNQNGVSGISGGTCIVITKNDKYVLVTSSAGNNVTIFMRDPGTGDLTYVQKISSHVSQPKSLNLSNDNKFLYVISGSNPSIASFGNDTVTGALTFIETITNGQNGVTGLSSCRAFEISPDDKNLYALCNSTIVVFTRNSIDGKLTYLQTMTNNQNGVAGLLNAYAIKLSPDKKNLYASSIGDSSIVTFSRDTTTGLLNYIDTTKIIKYQLGGGTYTSTAMISDNKRIYFTSYWEAAIHIFDRSESTGLISYDSTIKNGENSSVNGLYRAYYTCISPDRKNVYVMTQHDGISVFQRNDTTGNLNYFKAVNCIVNGRDLLNGSKSMVISPDNLIAFASDPNDSAIVIFNRDTVTGDLSYWKLFKNVNIKNSENLILSKDTNFMYVSIGGYGDLVTLKYDKSTCEFTYVDKVNIYSIDNWGGDIMKMEISNDDKYLFAITDASSDALFMFLRNDTTGKLTYKTRYRSNYVYNTGMQILRPFTISNDCKNIYVTSFLDNSIHRFNIENDSMYFVGEITYANTGIAGLKHPTTIQIDKDDKIVYILSSTDNSISVFDRNVNTCDLSFVRTFKEPFNPVDGLDDGNIVSLSSDNRSFYVTSYSESSVAGFKRNFYLGNDMTACYGDTLKLSAGKSYKHYNWSTNDTTSYINVTSSGLYSVTVIDAFGITETDSLNVLFNPLPVVELGIDTEICSGNSTILTIPGNYDQYLWSNGVTNDSLVVSSPGEYILTVIDSNGCSKIDSINIKVNPLPSINITGGQSICSGDTAVIIVNGSSDTYTWDNGMTGDTILVSPVISTTYYVTGTDSNNCSKNSNSMVTVIPAPSTPVLTMNSDTLISNYSLGNQWYLNDTIINGAIGQNYICVLDGEYYVIVTLNGCISDTSNVINVINVGLNEVSENNIFKIYPNPANEKLIIESTQNSIIEILNNLGQTILQQQIQQGKTDFDISGLAKGVYILKLNTIDRTVVKKIVKE
jgi:6-phosphogluconolactonase (cycloisomerase 2 family)